MPEDHPLFSSSCDSQFCFPFQQTVFRNSLQIRVKLLLPTLTRRTLTTLIAHGPSQWTLDKTIMFSVSNLPLLIWNRVKTVTRTTWK